MMSGCLPNDDVGMCWTLGFWAPKTEVEAAILASLQLEVHQALDKDEHVAGREGGSEQFTCTGANKVKRTTKDVISALKNGFG